MLLCGIFTVHGQFILLFAKVQVLVTQIVFYSPRIVAQKPNSYRIVVHLVFQSQKIVAHMVFYPHRMVAHMVFYSHRIVANIVVYSQKMVAHMINY